MKTVGITGGTGLIGKHLTALLLEKGYEVVIFTRNISLKAKPQNLSYAHWDANRKECDNAALRRLDAIVHLAGAGLADKRWTAKRKHEITDSRVKGTEFLVSLLKQHAAPKCTTFIAASACGYYGPDKNQTQPFSETAPPHNDFLGTTCKEWEAASQKASEFARTVILRFGIVLGRESGAFHEFAKPMTFGIMPILGSGTQVMSWIEVNDLARLLLFSIENAEISGVYNAVTPTPVTQKSLVKTIASSKRMIRIPFPVPAFMLKVLLGEVSSEVLKSCTVVGNKITNAGFKFEHPVIDSAVKAILAPGSVLPDL